MAKGEDGRTDMTSQMDAILYLLFVNFQIFYYLQNKEHSGFKKAFIFNKSHGICFVYTSKRIKQSHYRPAQAQRVAGV